MYPSIRFVLSLVLVSHVYACSQEKRSQPDALGAPDGMAVGGMTDGSAVGPTAQQDARQGTTDAPAAQADAPWPGMPDGLWVLADGPVGADGGKRDVADAAPGKLDAVVVDANLGRDLVGPQPSLCFGRRTNLTEDPMNCGTCGNVCEAHCSEGVCVDACQLPLVPVGSGLCVDPRTDPRNCGGLPCTGAQVCQAGRCTGACGLGESLCAGACVVLSMDNKNCGSCGQVCPTGTGCASGVCLPCSTLFPALPWLETTAELTGVLTADLNGDGRLDLVIAGGGIGTFLGNGDGTFAAERRIAADMAGTPSAGDIDGDGKVDLLAASPQGDALVLLPGLGDGLFGTPRSYPVSASGRPLMADVNADGRLDVATIGADNAVKVLLGGTGFDLAPAQSYAIETPVTLMDKGDLDGDGKLDLVLAGASDGRVYALFGVGDGTFKAPQLLQTMAGLSALAVGDLNNDGKADIVLDVNREVWVLRRSASGDYPRGSAGISVPKAQGPLFLVDVNGDDRLDVVVGSEPRGTDVHVLLSASYGRVLGSRQTTTVGEMDAIAVGDFNRDGRPDVARANRSAKSVGILLGLGQGTFRAGAQGGGAVLNGLIVADLDKDGLADILGHKSGYKLLSIFRGKFGWGLEETWDIPAEAGSVFAVADMNGDGQQDIVIGSSKAKNICLVMSTADGRHVPGLYNLDTMMNAMVLGDWNGDGKIDIAAASYDASDVTVVLGKGGTSLGTATHHPVPSGPGQIFAVDIDGDGKQDLLVSGPGSISYLASKGDGTFAAAKSLSSVGGWIQVGDFDENGIADFAALGLRDTASSSPAIGVFLGAGGGVFAAAKMYPYDSLARDSEFSVGDMDGDGHLDMMLPGSSSNSLTYWLGRGDGSFAQPTLYSSRTSSRLADLDYDGRSDLIVFNNNAFGVMKGPRDCARSP